MKSDNNLDDKSHSFEKMVSSSFNFLEQNHEMKRGRVRISNRRDPRDVTFQIRYESKKYRFDIGWGIGNNGFGIVVKNKLFIEKNILASKECSVHFEPFVEFLTNGSVKPIVPQVYPKMSVSKLCNVADEREELFEQPLVTLIDRLAEKLKANYTNVTSQDPIVFVEFHRWMASHR